MSTKRTIDAQARQPGRPGFHLYDEPAFSTDDEPPVYLRLEGVDVDVSSTADGTTVTVAIPRDLARTLGLIPAATEN